MRVKILSDSILMCKEIVKVADKPGGEQLLPIAFPARLHPILEIIIITFPK